MSLLSRKTAKRNTILGFSVDGSPLNGKSIQFNDTSKRWEFVTFAEGGDFLPLAGGTMEGDIEMGASPTVDSNKIILGSWNLQWVALSKALFFSSDNTTDEITFKNDTIINLSLYGDQLITEIIVQTGLTNLSNMHEKIYRITEQTDNGPKPINVTNFDKIEPQLTLEAIEIRPLWEIRNNEVTLMQLTNDGEWDFQDHVLSDVKRVSYKLQTATPSGNKTSGKLYARKFDITNREDIEPLPYWKSQDDDNNQKNFSLTDSVIRMGTSYDILDIPNTGTNIFSITQNRLHSSESTSNFNDINNIIGVKCRIKKLVVDISVNDAVNGNSIFQFFVNNTISTNLTLTLSASQKGQVVATGDIPLNEKDRICLRLERASGGVIKINSVSVILETQVEVS